MIKVKYGTAYATRKTDLNKKNFAEFGKIMTYCGSYGGTSVELQDGKYKEVMITELGVKVTFYDTLTELRADAVINNTWEV